MEINGGDDQMNSARARSSGEIVRNRGEALVCPHLTVGQKGRSGVRKRPHPATRQKNRAQAPILGHQMGEQEWRAQVPTLAHVLETQKRSSSWLHLGVPEDDRRTVCQTVCGIGGLVIDSWWRPPVLSLIKTVIGISGTTGLVVTGIGGHPGPPVATMRGGLHGHRGHASLSQRAKEVP